jgi:CxxC motif-containing protein (DUF1111 family)
LGLCVVLSQVVGGGLVRAGSEPSKPDVVAAGYEIFNREWMPNDPRSHGGDGLGPVYNDTSCVACHNSGGSGGAGPVSKNIDILSASRNVGMPVQQVAQPGSANAACVPGAAPTSLEPLAKVHAGFRTSRTVVLHKFGTDPNYDSWRSQVFNQPVPQQNNGNPFELVQVFSGVGQSPFGNDVGQALITGVAMDQPVDARAAMRIQQVQTTVVTGSSSMRQPPVAMGSFLVARSQRNPTPLFGLGVIDAIPEEAIEAMAQQEAKKSPGIQGRASRLKDGRIGRLGWKGQTASVEDFVLNACAVELGLEVPGHHQAIIPQAPKYRTTGLDLTSDECAALVAYVKSLPRPLERRPAHAAETKHIEGGRTMFASVGCADCHAPKLGNVVGIYSDLLLHDMGQEMADDGSYSESSDDGSDEPLVPQLVAEAASKQPGQVQQLAQQPGRRVLKGATRREWRTPPLWGFRDSGPYLHDGRAQTLDQAVAMHGGQGAAAAQKFFGLTPGERLQVEAFLKSLVAPPASRPAGVDGTITLGFRD